MLLGNFSPFRQRPKVLIGSPFSLLEVVQLEAEMMASLKFTGLLPGQSLDVVHRMSTEKKEDNPGAVDAQVFDVRDNVEKSTATEESGMSSVLWWNNVAKDRRYQKWPKSLYEVRSPLSNSPA
jgi:hypothetical protein